MQIEPFSNVVEGFFVCGSESYTVRCTVREIGIQQLALFILYAANVK